jgi:hypothetical protein
MRTNDNKNDLPGRDMDRQLFPLDTDVNVYVEANVYVAIDVAVGKDIFVYGYQHNT